MKIQILTFSFLIAILGYSNSYAQWSPLVNIIPQNHRVWAVKIAPDSSVWITASLDFGHITSVSHPSVYRFIDDGNTWNGAVILQAHSIGGADISPVNKDITYLAADSSGLFRTVDGGQTWSTVDSFPGERAFFVHFFNEYDGWVLGADFSPVNGHYLMFVTTDGGNSWTTFGGKNWVQPIGTSLPIPDTTEFFAISFSNAAYDFVDETIMIGTNHGGYWKSTDKGYNWSRHVTPLADSSIATSNITMKDENTFMVAGDYFNDTLAGNYTLRDAINFTTRDSGNTWIQGNPGVTAAAAQYIPNTDSVFVMVGHRPFSGVGGSGTVISFDYGATWQRLHNSSFLSIDFLDENIGYGSCCNYAGWGGFGAKGEVYKWTYKLPSSNSIDESASPEWIRLRPNPVSTHLIVEIDPGFRHQDLAIEIITSNGQILSRHQSGYSDLVRISVRDLPRGYYFLSITGDQNRITKKFVKE